MICHSDTISHRLVPLLEHFIFLKGDLCINFGALIFHLKALHLKTIRLKQPSVYLTLWGGGVGASLTELVNEAFLTAALA